MLNVIKWLFEMLNAKIFRMLDVNTLTQPKHIEKTKSWEKLDPLIQSNCTKWNIKITLFFFYDKINHNMYVYNSK